MCNCKGCRLPIAPTSRLHKSKPADASHRDISRYEEPPDPEEEEVPALVNKGYHVQDWAQAQMGRFPRPVLPPPLPPIKVQAKELWHSPQRDFDDYETGPDMSALEPFEDLRLMLGDINLVYIADQIISNPWTTFKDYGFRIEPKFLQQFHLGPPILVREHMMQSAIKTESSPFQDSQSHLQLTRRGDPIFTLDQIPMGAEEMIRQADSEQDNGLAHSRRRPSSIL
ncbi:hypothetical protein H0H93_016098 [Arthromyces matolae]|nr:hypothetical protein H0H93_016098 [Arthromyces matolae]